MNNQERYNEIKRMEFLRRGGSHWMFDFTEQLNDLKRREEYDKVWSIIKKKKNL